ncbi:hypothetical protein C4577_06065 [Candidatus Parcubacteria bacterium]|nr:MAG: hypothetical protein C4577_06065 [Candidatus Parcubacteria bacterium]
MERIKLSSILLFILAVTFIMQVRISPSTTPYWLFGLIFLALLLFLSIDIIKIKENIYFKLKEALLWIIVVTIIGSAFGSSIIVRHQTAPVYQVHDIILQQESAIRFLLDGKNPYSATYFNTPLEEWHYSDTEINPALYHFVMEPFYLIFSLPFYFVSNHTIGYFDGRIPLLFLFLSTLLLTLFLIKDQEKRHLFIALFTFNPATVYYTLEGRSDIFMFAFLFAGLFLLCKQKYSLSGIPIALAFAVKQSAWPLFPFYIAFLYFRTKSWMKTAQAIIPFVLVFAIIVAPFLLWNSKAFIDSTINYLSGSTQHSYPIAGYGFGKLLNEFGFIKDVNAYYPFQIWQAIIGVPLFTALVMYLKKSPQVSRLILVYGIFLFVYWYFSRYFHNSHLGYLSMLFLTAYFWPKE